MKTQQNIIPTTGLHRKTTDKYYTSESCAKLCMETVLQYISISIIHDICIEPSAGNGIFIPHIKDCFNNYFFYDIEPDNDEIITQDYLSLSIDQIKQRDKQGKVHIIGNPPFGRQSSLAIKFIKKSCLFCDTISFILPKSFKKESMKKHFPLSFHNLCELELPHDSFRVNNTTYDVPCIFQIWEKRDYNRLSPIVVLPSHFVFVKKHEHPDVSFRRVGVYAGKIDTEIESKSEQSHYFIKFDLPVTNVLFTKLSGLQFTSKDNTVGPKSISKQELIQEINTVFDKLDEIK